ncbi:MAG TPA: 4-hydroxythreonine-4-phosphate dehydrogenase PdxA [Bacteroidales bacterium]|nr:4-hydroxythreonine-4-phosphate dehydrogenase PdxA [Bacteroidales bacterium]
MSTIDQNNILLAISHGDINGISYEIILKSLADNHIPEICTPVIYGSPKVAGYHRKALNMQTISLNHIKSPEEAQAGKVNIINCIDENARVELGKSTEIAGQASFDALSAAVKDMQSGKIGVLVTGPINKYNIQSNDFKFPGHTEYLQESFKCNEVLMLMVSENFKIGTVTGHIPLAQVPKYITKERILEKLRILNKSLIEDFAVRRPRIAVLGLNPHAGDDGLLGMEEKEIISPAIEQARNEDILALGPYPADGLFGSGFIGKFDAILAMYHDQGLAPFKAIAFERGVNFTAGLPIVRTSPAHGTAYDIAGKNEASPDSFKAAVYLALEVYKNRMEYRDLTKNKLQISKRNYGKDEALPDVDMPDDIILL